MRLRSLGQIPPRIRSNGLLDPPCLSVGGVALAFVGSAQAQQLSSPLIPFASTPIDPSSLIYLLQPVQFNNWQSVKTTTGDLAATFLKPCSAIAAGLLPPTGGGTDNVLYSDCAFRPIPAAIVPPPCSATLAGLLPATGGSATNVLYADCTFRPTPNSFLTGQAGTGTSQLFNINYADQVWNFVQGTNSIPITSCRPCGKNL